MSTNPLNYHPSTGNYMSEQEANSLIQKYDKNGDAILTKEELTALIIDQAASQCQQIKPKKEEVVCNKPQNVESFKMRLSRDELRDILLEHDIDGDGYLTRKELAQALAICGYSNSFGIANYALNLADADGDGHISVDELEKVLDYVEKRNRRKK